MLHAYVQKSDVTDTIEFFLGTKHDLKNRGKNTKIPFLCLLHMDIEVHISSRGS